MAKKCIYCSLEENGDISDNHPNFIDTINVKSSVDTPDYNFKYHGKIPFNAFVDFNGDGRLVFDLECYDCEPEGGIFHNTIYHKWKVFKINYCPMCGRKIRE